MAEEFLRPGLPPLFDQARNPSPRCSPTSQISSAFPNVCGGGLSHGDFPKSPDVPLPPNFVRCSRMSVAVAPMVILPIRLSGILVWAQVDFRQGLSCDQTITRKAIGPGPARTVWLEVMLE